MRGFIFTGFVAVIALTTFTVRAEDWKEPENGLFTEKQVENYTGAQKEILQLLKAMGKAAEGSKSGLGNLALLAGMDDKINVILAKHDLKKQEYDWLNGEMFKAFGAAAIDEMLDKAKTDMAEQKKKVATDLEKAKQKVDQYEKAKKNGTRVLTKEQRESAINSAKEAQGSATEEAKQHADEAKTAADEALKYEADAKAADALAKNPPADVENDAREDYIKGKKEEAEQLRTSAKEARDREKEARKGEAESKGKFAAAGKAITNPETPVGDEEKAQVIKENEAGLANAKSEAETLTQAVQLMSDSDGSSKKQRDELLKDIKPENLALVKKHLKELQEAWGMDVKKN
jgi:hypothetical protein